MCQRLLIKDPPDLNEQRKYALAPYDPPEKDSTSMFAAFEEAKKSYLYYTQASEQPVYLGIL